MSGIKDQLLGDTPYIYPHHPGWKAEGTSRAAAKAVSARSVTLRDFVLRALQTRPMTADEVAAVLGEDILSIRPRLSELSKMGKIAPTGERRANKSGLMARVLAAL